MYFMPILCCGLWGWGKGGGGLTLDFGGVSQQDEICIVGYMLLRDGDVVQNGRHTDFTYFTSEILCPCYIAKIYSGDSSPDITFSKKSFF